MNNFFSWLGSLFESKSYYQSIFTGSETHMIIVMNDNVNAMEYVVEALVDIFNTPEAQAVEFMMKIHNDGIAIIWAGNYTQAEQYLSQIKAAGLKSCIAPVPE